MSSTYFRIDEHKVPASHIRGFPRSTATKQEEVLDLAVKQYTPLSNKSPKPGDITIIAAHANGFPKELYEPLWDELLKRCEQHGFGIRGIWIADVVHQGWSGVLNEGKLGNDRMQTHMTVQSKKLILNSGMAGPQQRSAPHGQPLPRPNAPSHYWCRPQHGRLPTRKSCSSPSQAL